MAETSKEIEQQLADLNRMPGKGPGYIGIMGEDGAVFIPGVSDRSGRFTGSETRAFMKVKAKRLPRKGK